MAAKPPASQPASQPKEHYQLSLSAC